MIFKLKLIEVELIILSRLKYCNFEYKTKNNKCMTRIGGFFLLIILFFTIFEENGRKHVIN